MYEMSNFKDSFKEWKLLEKFRSYEKRGIVIGILIALVVVIIVTVCIIKYFWLKKQFDSLNYDLDDFYDEDDDDEDDEKCCEDGCCTANEKDFEKN